MSSLHSEADLHPEADLTDKRIRVPEEICDLIAFIAMFVLCSERWQQAPGEG